jgi:hypothetical protein
MNQSARLRIHSPKVANEIIDGEVIMINLDTGNYYSLDNVGALVWSLIAKQMTVQDVVDETARQYAGEAQEISDALTQLIDDLRLEGLIVIDETAAADGAPTLSAAGDTPASDRLPFTVPILQKYTDMQDLLLIDPIHEVDEAGWPMSKAETSF